MGHFLLMEVASSSLGDVLVIAGCQAMRWCQAVMGCLHALLTSAGGSPQLAGWTTSCSCACPTSYASRTRRCCLRGLPVPCLSRILPTTTLKHTNRRHR
ncbi:hypothetical protein V8C86DRAFT_2717872 [Haematococcus lacustris]